jgi:hypothetical protein
MKANRILITAAAAAVVLIPVMQAPQAHADPTDKQFQRPPRQCVKSVIRGYVLFDGRNISDPKRLRPRASSTTASAGTKENK